MKCRTCAYQNADGAAAAYPAIAFTKLSLALAIFGGIARWMRGRD